MKLTAIFALVFVFQLSANVYSQNKKFDLSLKDITVKEVLKNIEEQSDFRFFYNDELSDVNRKVSIDFHDQTVETILGILFSNTSVSYKVLENNLIVITPSELMKQQQKVTGKVTDATTGEFLPGVNIQVEGTITGTTTDNNGFYEVNATAENTLIFSFIGFISEKILVGQSTTINVNLVPDIRNLEEVIVVGYGVQKKSVVTGAISSIKSEDITNSSISRAEQALQGRTSGVQVIQNSGAPGAGINVRIRGYSSNKSSEPIYIVNGSRLSSIDNIDPNDIKNIEVLKDAASAAIYGAEGANGVVLITTKTGKAGKGQLSYEYQFGIQKMANKVDVLNASQFSTYMTEAGLLSNPTSLYNTDWQDEIFETSPTQKHYLSFTGGNERAAFLLSLSYLNQDGIVAGNKDQYKRYTLMFNSDYKILDWVKVGHNISFARTDLNSVSENSEYGSVISNALMMDPLTPVSYRGEVPASVQSLLDSGYKLLTDKNGDYYGISEYVNGEIGNPFVARDRSISGTQTNMLFGNIFADLTPFKGLTITTRFGSTVMSSDLHTYNPEYFYNASQFNDASDVAEIITLMTRWQWENFATYTQSFGDHNASLLIGMSSEEFKFRYLSANGGPLTNDNSLFDDLSYLANNPTDNVAGYLDETRKLSYFGRLNYDYKNKYMVQASLRRDAVGADILPEDNRWGLFPAISAGWAISNEDYFPKSVISFAKIRASWGQNGSISNLGKYIYASLLQSMNSYPLNEDGTLAIATEPASLSNNDLRWETSEQTDFGIDLRAFKDRLTFSMDYYIKKTKDLLTTDTPPLESGNSASYINAGNVENRGFEFELGYRNKIGNFTYNLNGNLATLHNEVTYLNPNLTFLEGASVNLQTATLFQKGQPIWYFYGYKTSGIDPATGDPVFLDKDGVDGITTADKTFIGSGIPEITYGGNIELGYKNIDFRIFMQGQAGNEVMLGMVRTDRPISNKMKVFYDDRWTLENTSASMPKASTNSDSWHSDLMVFNGSYLKIKQIQIGYRLPKNLAGKVKASNIRLYTSLENALTFTNYPGMDPEVGSSNANSIGIDRGMFPICRTLILGVSVNF